MCQTLRNTFSGCDPSKDIATDPHLCNEVKCNSYTLDGSGYD